MDRSRIPWFAASTITTASSPSGCIVISQYCLSPLTRLALTTLPPVTSNALFRIVDMGLRMPSLKRTRNANSVDPSCDPGMSSNFAVSGPLTVSSSRLDRRRRSWVQGPELHPRFAASAITTSSSPSGCIVISQYCIVAVDPPCFDHAAAGHVERLIPHRRDGIADALAEAHPERELRRSVV